MNANMLEYLIIGGVTKAGTTSLFNYLADHPEICPASFKETRFFLDLNYPLNSKYRCDSHGLEKYNEFYTQCPQARIRLEATPDYLYSDGCAARISKNIPKVKMIFILRDPIARLYSWYQFSQQDGKLGVEISFADYVEMQVNQNQSDLDYAPQHMRSLVQGCYAKYLKSFFGVLGERNCLIIHLEDLEKSPVEVMREICFFVAIEDEFYETYNFLAANKTQSMRFPKIHGLYKSLIHAIRKYTHHYPNLHKAMRLIRRGVDVIYLRANAKNSPQSPISEHLIEMLAGFYADDQRELEKLLQRQPKVR